MPRAIGIRGFCHFLGDRMPLPYEIVHNNTLVENIHKDEYVCHQVSVSYDFSLLISGVLSDNPFIKERGTDHDKMTSTTFLSSSASGKLRAGAGTTTER